MGPDSRARALRKAAKAGVGGGAAGGLAQGCSGCGDLGAGGGEAFVFMLVFLVVIAVAAIIGVIVWQIVKWIRERRENRPKPQGALYKAPRPRLSGVRARGRVVAGNPIAMPWTNAVALGWAFELFEKRVFGGGAMLRAAYTGGFDVALDDGRLLRIPPGRLRVASRLAETGVDAEVFDAYLADADPLREEEQPSLFPYDSIRAAAIRSEARVEIVSDIEPKPDETAGHTYRAGGGVFGPKAVPVLRIIDGGDGGGLHIRIADDPSQATGEAESEAESLRAPRPGARAP